MYLVNGKINNKLTLVATKLTKISQQYSYSLQDQKIVFYLNPKHFCFRQFN